MSTTYDKFEKVFDAEFPRYAEESTIPANSSLKIVTDHYVLREEFRSSNRSPVNIFFMYGTGMNKSIWNYFAKRLYEYSQSHTELSWQLINIVAPDMVNHGESAMLNKDKLGYEYDWREGSRDLVRIAGEMKLTGTNVAVGHSMGGFQVIYAASLAPTLFKFVVPIEPVMNQKKGYHTGESLKRLNNLFVALNRALVSEFPSEEIFYSFFRKKSIFKKFNKEILEEFIKAEKVLNPDGTVSAKTSKEQQLITYHGGMKMRTIALGLVEGINIPIVHVMGDLATWNDKESVALLRKHINILDPVNIAKGEHLVICEMPDEMIQVIINSLDKYITRGTKPAFTNAPPLEPAQRKAIFDEGYKQYLRKIPPTSERGSSKL